jgi:hypothetical protein
MVLICICTISTWALQVGCEPGGRNFGDEDDDNDNDDGSSDSDSDSDSDADSDADTDADTDADEDCDGIPWGSGWTIGNPVANFNITGYADTTGDHQVETTETTFSLEDIACDGNQSLLLVWSDWCST